MELQPPTVILAAIFQKLSSLIHWSGTFHPFTALCIYYPSRPATTDSLYLYKDENLHNAIQKNDICSLFDYLSPYATSDIVCNFLCSQTPQTADIIYMAHHKCM